ncbi:hypothetical protein SDIAM26S_05144 [Streptomyces diastaticus subsp. diastaticus]
MESAEIRRRWLRFFEERGHTVVPSASLIADDPTLLLVPAGMVPFKPYFLGEAAPPAPRATSVQKCVRTPDIEEVGKTTRHGTFFQMCGNFSFGDYFKEGAITYAWELLTSPQEQGGYGLDPERLWITVYLDDDEAETIWREKIGVPAERIQRLGKKDNFWSMGVPGPCGPCSEINYDRGPEFGVEGGPAVNDERYVEIWNLVFMQYERGAGEDKEDFPILGDLPSKNIDTGLGLERLAMILQDVRNLYEIDTSRVVIDKATELTGVRYGTEQASDVSLRVVTDHMRTSVMLIGDGVTPGNEGRGYVLRRIMRRAIRNMRLLGATGPVVSELVDTVIDSMGQQYPELVTERKRILTVALAEEAAFLKALKGGTNILDTAVTETKAARLDRALRGQGVPPPRHVGLPDRPDPGDGRRAGADRRRAGLPAPDEGAAGARQGRRPRQEDRPRRPLRLPRGRRRRRRHRLHRLPRHRGRVHRGRPAGRRRLLARRHRGRRGRDRPGPHPVLRRGRRPDRRHRPHPLRQRRRRRGPRRAEAGPRRPRPQGCRAGRRGDRGLPGLRRHRRRPPPGHRPRPLGHPPHPPGAARRARPDGRPGRSENQPGRFRFDFGSPAAVPGAVLTDVEQKINEVLARDLDVQAEVMSIDDAKKQGAIAEFGEKYGERVRVVTIGDFSKELCGGTHVHNTAQLGLVKLLGESSIGSGVRRIEALVGVDAYHFLAKEHTVVAQLQELVKGRPEELPEKVSAMLGKLKEAEKEIERFRAEKVLQAAAGLAAGAQDVRGTALVTGRVPDGTGADDLRKLVLDVRGRIPSDRPAVVALFTVAGDRPLTVVATNEAARERGLKAGDLVRTAAKTLGGGGGGKPDVAQGGGQNPQAIDEAVSAVERQVAESAR